jgi:hypothetical protein
MIGAGVTLRAVRSLGTVRHSPARVPGRPPDPRLPGDLVQTCGGRWAWWSEGGQFSGDQAVALIDGLPTSGLA